MALTADVEQSGEDTLRLLEMLGTAWSTFALYPDPTDQPAFARAVDALSEPITPPLVVGIGPGIFLLGQEELEVQRDGTERLARELFLHDVEYLRLKGGTSAEDLVTFFEIVDTDDDRVREMGGISEVTHSSGTAGLDVFERGLLVLAVSDGGEEEADPALAAMLLDLEGLSRAAAAATRGAEPEEIAEILSERPGSPGPGGEREGMADPAVSGFLSGLNELHGHAAPYAETPGRITGALREGASDPWKGFRTFLEAFFHLDRPAQLMVLEAILAEHGSVARGLFLDQLSGADLTEYMSELSEEGRAALVTYSLVEGGGVQRRGEALEDISSSRDVATARQAVASRISMVLRTAVEERPATEEMVASLRSEMSAEIDSFDLGAQVLRGLLQAEDRERRLARVVRVWTGRVSRHLRDGDWQSGRRLLDAILTDPPYGAAKEALVREAVERVAGRETLRLVLDREFGSQPSEEAMGLFDAFGVAVVGPLVDMLAAEEDGQRRRLLTELLAQAARPDPRSLDGYVVGQPWYVQRNIATVLGKTGKVGALPGLRQLLRHDDHRVRVEALRGIVRIERSDAAPILVKMLEDPHERVRQNAATLARSSESAELDAMLARELAEDRLAPDVAVVVVRILAARPSSEARALIERLAAQRFALKGSARALREAARQALKGIN